MSDVSVRGDGGVHTRIPTTIGSKNPKTESAVPISTDTVHLDQIASEYLDPAPDLPHSIPLLSDEGESHICLEEILDPNYFSYSAIPSAKVAGLRDTPREMKMLVVYAGFKDSNVGNRPPTWLSPTLDEVSRFYQTESRGKFTLSPTVLSKVYRSQSNMEAYGGAYGEIDKLGGYTKFVREILQEVDKEVDFRDYDANSDGEVDGIAIVLPQQAPNGFFLSESNSVTGIAFLGLNEGGVLTNFTTNEGVTISSWKGSVQRTWDVEIAKKTFAHEFGHILRLPDMYKKSFTQTGWWDLMGASGNAWGNHRGIVPFSGPSLVKLGWASVEDGSLVDITTNQYNLSIKPYNKGGSLYRIPLSPGQDFIIENRNHTSPYDEHIPGDGLLIWHRKVGGRWVDLESPAEGTADDVSEGGQGSERDLFQPGDSFGPDTVPNSHKELSSTIPPTLEETGISVTNIRQGDEEGELIVDVIVEPPSTTAVSEKSWGEIKGRFSRKP